LIAEEEVLIGSQKVRKRILDKESENDYMDEGRRIPFDSVLRYKIEQIKSKNPLLQDNEDEKCTCIKVLVVDDVGFNITCMRIMLKNQNLDCHDASNGE